MGVGGKIAESRAVMASTTAARSANRIVMLVLGYFSLGFTTVLTVLLLA